MLSKIHMITPCQNEMEEKERGSFLHRVTLHPVAPPTSKINTNICQNMEVLQLQHLPKIQKNLGPSFYFVLLSSLALFDFCSRFAFMPAMFHGLYWFCPTIESVLDCWVGSVVNCTPAVAEKNKTSSPIQALLVFDVFFLYRQLY